MNTARLHLAAGALLVAALSMEAAEPAKGYERYQFFKTRNVFDPDRRPVVRAAATPAPGTTVRRPSPVVLTGTMETDGKTLAFFASPEPALNKILPVNQSIAGFTITRISAGVVETERAGKKLLVSVGSALPIEGAGPMPAPETLGDASATPATPAGDGAAVSPAPAAAAGGAPDADEVRRRMMERRQKEMSR